jgi:Eco29kI restriction endonuclease
LASHAHFEIDIVSALSSQLVAAFSMLDLGPLTSDEVNSLPKGQGVYKLYHHGSLVYVGKSDSVKKRLGEHKHKISGRLNIDVADMGFKCLLVHPNWTTLAPENSLIKYYRKAREGECAWNGNGFGPHDPGRERETTNKAPDGFDAQYPIRQDWLCDWIKAGEVNAAELLKAIKGGLPYLLRYQTAKSHEPRAAYQDLTVTVPQDDMSARDLLRTIAQALPGWQATAFPSHMILYKEHRTYTHGLVIWPE